MAISQHLQTMAFAIACLSLIGVQQIARGIKGKGFGCEAGDLS
jgi:hypothetical protein